MLKAAFVSACVWMAMGVGHKRVEEVKEVCTVIWDAVEEVETDEAWSPCQIGGLGWMESRLTYSAVSHAGAVGPLQVLPRFAYAHGFEPVEIRQHCPSQVWAGILILDAWQKRCGEDAINCYVGGAGRKARGQQKEAQRAAWGLRWRMAWVLLEKMLEMTLRLTK